MTAVDALTRLIEGNKRFVSGVRSVESMLTHTKRAELATKQEPFAIILGCSDSRVPAELVFDQGLGDLFVIRVAGNIVAPSQVGSVEFAAGQFEARLVVVMGHSQCGAVSATIDEMRQHSPEKSQNIRSIVDRIRPSIASLMDTDLKYDNQALLEHAIRANVRSAADHLRHGSATLEKMIAEDDMLVVGAEYSLETGVVDFFDGLPASF